MHASARAQGAYVVVGVGPLVVVEKSERFGARSTAHDLYWPGAPT